MKRLIGFLLLMVIQAGNSLVQAQCAMCRATIANNVSNGDESMGAGLNAGILYLLTMPYLAIGVVAFLWYRKSKANARKISIEGSY